MEVYHRDIRDIIDHMECFEQWEYNERQAAGRRGDLMAQEQSARKEAEAFFSA